MSRGNAVSINLDDVFGDLPALTTATNVKSSESGSRSRKTTASSVSTVREVPIGNGVRSHASTAVSHAPAVVTAPPPPVNATPISHYYDATPTSDPLLDSIFSAVTLPTVNLNGGHDDALRHLDEALYGEDHESIASEPAFQAPSHVSSSHVSSHVSSQRQPYATGNHPQNASVVSNGSAKHYDAYGSEPQPDYEDEKSDHFNLHHQYPVRTVPVHRDRSNTIDSSASFAESRFGQFDVHDDHDRYHGEEINLHHNEVAYERPESNLIYSSPGSVHSHHSHSTFHTGGTQKLRSLQRQVEDARAKKAQLSHQVDRQRADNDRLTHANLAREASLKVHNIGQGAKPLGYHVRSYSHEHDNHHHHLPPQPKSSHSSKSVDSSIYEEEEVRVSPLAAKQKASGEHIANSGKYELIVPQYYVVENFSKNDKINKVIIGGDAPASDDDKTLLLFGPIGSGKTSAITSMMNYLYDVKKENDFRFVLDEHVNATTGLTAYVFNNTVLPYNVTVVDTPGVEDRMGNKTVSRLIKQWFEKELLESGAFRLDAISIVLKHDENQLGWPFIYELADVKRMFGDDLKTNVLPIITNSEVLPQPIAIKSLTQANISFLEYYKVNNSGFAPLPTGISKLQHNLYWTHGTASLENLFRDLQETVHPLVAILRHNKGQRVEQAPVFADKVLY
uniref:G domain-containing protein n=1 Tax=Caenorhabditis tropicalis TaxID=1561998 RepID=A0A1I7UQ09_9PELO